MLHSDPISGQDFRDAGGAWSVQRQGNLGKSGYAMYSLPSEQTFEWAKEPVTPTIYLSCNGERRFGFAFIDFGPLRGDATNHRKKITVSVDNRQSEQIWVVTNHAVLIPRFVAYEIVKSKLVSVTWTGPRQRFSATFVTNGLGEQPLFDDCGLRK
jgi:hypothetical protein